MEMHSRFEIIRTLGHGGMATVYLAYDGQDGRNVALKVLASNLAGDDVYRARFLREARLAARVRHPNVVRVYGVGEDARGPFIAMEVVEGPTLADEITRRGRFSPETRHRSRPSSPPRSLSSTRPSSCTGTSHHETSSSTVREGRSSPTSESRGSSTARG